jgi:hypothetical protein
MLHRLIYADWDAPPEVMAFEKPLREILAKVRVLLPRILAGKEAALLDPAGAPAAFWDDCLALYLYTPAMVNVALNYKICVEQGLPLHPTYYFSLREGSRFKAEYEDPVIIQAQAQFLDAIQTARAIFALEDQALGLLNHYESALPTEILDFIYVSARDKYTWRASNPKRIISLAETVLKAFKPALVVGAAHGSIMSGLIFANLVEAPLYFVRFSMFKRNDLAPVLASSDLAFLETFRATGPVLLFDEDVAKGTTLTKFSKALKPLFQESYTGSVLRHALSPCRPDFTGHAWSD